VQVELSVVSGEVPHQKVRFHHGVKVEENESNWTEWQREDLTWEPELILKVVETRTVDFNTTKEEWQTVARCASYYTR
jgi:hypothetical protein